MIHARPEALSEFRTSSTDGDYTSAVEHQSNLFPSETDFAPYNEDLLALVFTLDEDSNIQLYQSDTPESTPAIVIPTSCEPLQPRDPQPIHAITPQDGALPAITPHDELLPDLNFILAFWNAQRKFIAQHKTLSGNSTISEADKLKIKINAFTTATMIITAKDSTHEYLTSVQKRRKLSQFDHDSVGKAEEKDFKANKKARIELAGFLIRANADHT